MSNFGRLSDDAEKGDVDGEEIRHADQYIDE